MGRTHPCVLWFSPIVLFPSSKQMFTCIKGIYVSNSGLCVCLMTCAFGNRVGTLQVSGLGLFKCISFHEISNLSAFNPAGWESVKWKTESFGDLVLDNRRGEISTKATCWAYRLLEILVLTSPSVLHWVFVYGKVSMHKHQPPWNWWLCFVNSWFSLLVVN